MTQEIVEAVRDIEREKGIESGALVVPRLWDRQVLVSSNGDQFQHRTGLVPANDG